MKKLVYASVISLAALATGCVYRVYVPPPPVAIQPVPPPPYAAQPTPPPAMQPPPGAPQPAPPTMAPAPDLTQPAPPSAVAPAPMVAPGPYIPDYYVWDGYEYVGVCGNQYVYWNGGGWLVCDGIILGRFYGWERFHPGWRRGAFRYRRGR